MKKYRHILLVMVFCAGLTACARTPVGSDEFARQAETVHTVADALRLWGEPDAEGLQSDGRYRRTWIVYDETAIPGHIRTLPNVPSTTPVDPAWRPYVHGRSYPYDCNVAAVSDFRDSGPVILEWRGNSCNRLAWGVPRQERNTLPPRSRRNMEIQESHGAVPIPL